MIKKVKKLILALSLLLGALIGNWLSYQPKVVYADSGTLEKRESTVIPYAEFRHPEASVNTWYQGGQILFINGQMVICIDPTTYAHEVGYAGKEFEETEVLQTSSGRHYEADRELQKTLALVSYYGVKENYSDLRYHMTTWIGYELLGWVIQEVRDGVTMEEYQAFKAEIMAKVNAYKKSPSWDTETHTLKVGDSVVLVDTNNVVQNLVIPNEINGFTTSVKDNKLTLTATEKAKNGTVTFKQDFNALIHGVSMVYRADGSQTVADFKVGDPQFGKLNLNVVKNGQVKVIKKDLSSGKLLDNVEFGLFDKNDKLVEKAVTNAKGELVFNVTDTTRKFYIKETQAKQGYFLNGQRFDVTVKPGQTQTIEVANEPVPTIVTEATTFNGGKIGDVFEKHKEVATMTNLVIGQAYKMFAIQYDTTGKAHARQEREFIAKNTTHTEVFEFTVPKGYTGDLVYGEELYRNNEKVAVHFDLTNKKQTVTVTEPSVTTLATTKEGGKIGHQYEKHIEVAKMTGLLQGKTYTVFAYQLDETGKKYATQERTFIATSSTHKETFEFDVPKDFTGYLVYAEEVYRNGQLVSVHYDLTNKDQTITVKNPEVITEATTEKNEKTSYGFEKHIEEFTASNLIVGRKYKAIAYQYALDGTLLSQQEREFIAKNTTHKEYFEFNVPVGYYGKVVYAEDLFDGNEKVAVHFDLTNEKQTVTVLQPKINTLAQIGGTKEMTVGERKALVDILKYENFKNGKVLVSTWLVKYGTDEIVGDKVEQALELDGNGEVTVKLDKIDTSKLPAGKYTIMEQVFEVVEKDGKTEKGNLISEHVDNKDENQSFVVKEKPVQPILPYTGSQDTVLFALIGLLATLGGIVMLRRL